MLPGGVGRHSTSAFLFNFIFRVCDELGGPGPGVRPSLCGYQIRFEAKRCDTTRLLYCTTGVLLRQLQLDPLLDRVSCVVVDEVCMIDKVKGSISNLLTRTRALDSLSYACVNSQLDNLCYSGWSLYYFWSKFPRSNSCHWLVWKHRDCRG